MASRQKDTLNRALQEPFGRMQLAAGMMASALLILMGTLMGEPVPLKLGAGIAGLVLIGIWINARARRVHGSSP